MSAFRHFNLLLWKNFLLQLRHPWVTFFEIVIPCFFIAMVAGIRVAVKVTHYENSTFYEPFDIYHMPSINMSYWHTYKILYAPSIEPYDQVIIEVKNKLDQFNLEDRFPQRNNYHIQGFPTEDELIYHYLHIGENASVVLCGVVFENSPNNHRELKFKLRFPSSPTHQLGEGPPFKSWYTQATFPQFSVPGPRQRDYSTGGQPGYYEEGFLSIQHLVSMAFLDVIQNRTTHTGFNDFEVVGQRFPYPPYIDDTFLVALQFLFPIILMFSFIYTPCNLTKNLVLEKEKRLKESMKMMGLKEWMHWLAWFTKYVIWMTITVAIMVILLCIKLRDGVGILNKSDWSLVFVLFLLYGINTIAFSFMVSTIFSKANVAGVGTGVLFFLTFMPYFTTAQKYLSVSLVQKLLTGILHNTNMAFGAIIIAMWEGNDVGIQWSNLHETASPDDNLTLLYVIIMFIIDTFLYFLITWYISIAFPGEYGIPQKWYFPFTKSYWCSPSYSRDSEGIQNNGFDLYTRDEIDLNNRLNSNYFESEPQNMPKGIQIKGLSKTFDGGDTYAVTNLNLSTYSGQITALLGHNGAGKTTTMSILTGLFPPSSGTAIVNGYDIRSDIENIRSSLGICPQFDVLFDELTVEEHLRFFCRLKNVTDPEVVECEILNMIELLALTDKSKAQAHTLSGGMKRKLSVGIALIGGSKTVILDEPTSGMDVSARRFIWDLLLEMKEDRTILLSTHFMEEADILGDRIAIMANGKLQCCGSPLFLKKKYGAGYRLTISKKTSATDVTPITRLIQTHIPNGKLETSGGTELAYSLPNEDSSRFEALFAEIESRQQELGIGSYGASITTMEEVFLKVGEYAEEGIKAINDNKNGINSKPEQSYLPMDAIDRSSTPQRNTGIALLSQQFYGLVFKKILYGWRNPFLTSSQILLPVLFTISSILIGKSNPKPGDSEALDMNLVNFKSTKVPYFYDSKTWSLSENYEQLMDENNIGVGVNSTLNNLTVAAMNYLDQSSRNDISYYSLHQPIGAIFEKDNLATNHTRVTALFNNQAFHTPGIALRFVDSAIIKQVLNQSDFNLNVVNHPMPRTTNEILLSAQYQTQDQFQVAQNLMFSMSFLAASFAILLVRERAIKGKHLQMVCGVKLYIFWTASYIVDFLIYLIPCFLVMLMYKAFNEEALASPAQEGRLLLLFIVHGLAMLPFVYVLSFMFDVPSTAYVRICIYNVIFGIGTFLAVVITELPALDVVYISKPLNTLFSMFLPNFCLGRSVYNLYNNHFGNDICNTPKTIEIGTLKLNGTLVGLCNTLCALPNPLDNPLLKSIRMCCKNNKCVEPDSSFPWEENYLSINSPGIGQLLLWLFFQMVFYWVLIILIEYNVFRSLQYLYENLMKGKDKNETTGGQYGSHRTEDEDVAEESNRLQSTELEKLVKDNALIIKNLTKNYGSLCAVDNISYGVKKGECFGLLGVNGAGKTTTFKMITGDEPITNGDIYVNGFDIKKDIKQVQRQIGYCPQFDGLLDQLTGKETLTLFSRLRGIREKDIPDLIVDISHLLYFDMHIDKQVGKYSGGTKRKLSTAVALLGSPSVSFLDEPTTGVDPVARRCLWDALTKKLYEGCSIVLTSHSMEECEALCTRLIIMVNGKICCIGSPQHLKNKFGKGYIVQIKVLTTEGRERTTSGVGRRLSRQISNQSQKKRSLSIDSNKISQFVYNRQTSELITAQNMTDVRDFMTTAFPGSQLKATHNNLLEFSINDEKLTWSQIFGRIERAKHRINIEDYSIGQTTLEQIFLSFARKQREAAD